MPDTPAPPSRNGNGRNAALVGVGLFIASQVPTTLASIPNPVTRGLVQLLAVIIVLWFGVRIR